MNSLIVQTAARALLPLLLVFSVFLLLRGHHEPGGGFVGGLVGGGTFALYALASGPEAARRALRVDPRDLVGIGLLLAALSGLASLGLRRAPFTGLWTTIEVPGLGAVDVGTPLAFDVGVYLVVAGVTLTILLALMEER